MRDKKERAIVRAIAEDMKISSTTAMNVVDSVTEFIALTIKAGSYEGVKVPNWGTYWVKQGRKDNIEKLIRKKIANGAVPRRKPRTNDRPGNQADTGV